MGARKHNGGGCLVPKYDKDGNLRGYLGRWMVDRKIHTQMIYETDKRKAERRLAELTAPYQTDSRIQRYENIQAQIVGLKKYQEEMKLEAAGLEFDAVLPCFFSKNRNLTISDETKTLTENIWSGFIRWLKEDNIYKWHKYIKQIDKTCAEKYLAYLFKKVSISTYNGYLGRLKLIWETVKEDGCVRDNVWANFKPLKGAKSGEEKEAFTHEQIRKILQLAQKDFEWYAFILTAIYTGLRKEDVMWLVWDDVKLDEGIIVTYPRKTKKHLPKPVTIPIHPTLNQHFIDLMKVKKDGFVFPNISKIQKGSVSDRFRAILDKLGLPRYKVIEGKRKAVYNFSCLRNTFNVICVESGISPLDIQKMMGHTTVDMTATYYRENRIKLESAVAKLPTVTDSTIDMTAVKIPKAIFNKCKELDIDIMELIIKEIDKRRTAAVDTIEKQITL